MKVLKRLATVASLLRSSKYP